MTVLKVLNALPEPTSWYMLKSESLTEKLNVSNVFVVLVLPHTA